MQKTVEINTLADLLSYNMFATKSSVRDVARATGLAPSTVWRVANGRTPSVKALWHIANWCGLKSKDIWLLLELYANQE